MRAGFTLVLACFALAAGIALGAGPLAGDDDTTTPAKQASAQPRQRAASGLDDSFAAAVAPTLYDRRLANQTVTILALPGADETVLKGLTDQIVAAGGAVTSRVTLTEGLTAPGEKSMVDTLATQLATQMAGSADPAATTYVRMGQLLGTAFATTDAAAAPTPDIATIRQSLVAGSLADDAGTAATAPLVLVATGTDLEDTIVTGLVEGIAAKAHGVVVVGDSFSGDIAAVRATGTPAATVDGVETPAGQVAAVLALVRQITGGGGQFGASGIDGPIPVG
ncbi:copper transporter [Nocardioides sp.]|uniref:copper transporter n=1 Tax=Nocardioides sp. TaxID=35761 RepID=UPI0039E50959